jgi:hypothetical protein
LLDRSERLHLDAESDTDRAEIVSLSWSTTLKRLRMQHTHSTQYLSEAQAVFTTVDRSALERLDEVPEARC